MANENRYYKTPFAESGTKAEVPDVSVGGAVGYDTGFGPDYGLPKDDIDRKNVERNYFNGLNNSITKNLKQWQEGLYPTWIEDDGDGAVFLYPIDMIVAHNGSNWRSLVADNQEEPGTGVQWSESVTLGDVVRVGYEMSTATYANKSFDPSSQEVAPLTIAFSTDGLRMFILGGINDTVFQYTLSTAWDVSTATYANKLFDPSDQGISFRYIAFSTDGLRMFILGDSNNTVFQYTLSTAWDVSTATYANKSFDPSGQDPLPVSMAFSTDGLRMFILGDSNNTVFQYTLSTAWDVSTATYANKSFDPSGQETVPISMAFSTDGLRMFILGLNNDTVFQYTLSTAWDVSTATYANKSFDPSGQETVPISMAFSTDGLRMFILGTGNYTVFQYYSGFITL